LLNHHSRSNLPAAKATGTNSQLVPRQSRPPDKVHNRQPDTVARPSLDPPAARARQSRPPDIVHNPINHLQPGPPVVRPSLNPPAARARQSRPPDIAHDPINHPQKFQVVSSQPHPQSKKPGIREPSGYDLESNDEGEGEEEEDGGDDGDYDKRDDDEGDGEEDDDGGDTDKDDAIWSHDEGRDPNIDYSMDNNTGDDPTLGEPAFFSN
jgi:hypothetical protein